MPDPIERGAEVQCADGRLGTITAVFRDVQRDIVTDIAVHDETMNQTFLIAPSVITGRTASGAIVVSSSREEVRQAESASGAFAEASATSARAERSEDSRIELVEDQLNLRRARRLAGEIGLRIITDTKEETQEVPVSRDEVFIERIAAGDDVDGESAPYWEGDSLVVPVVEERLFVQKRRVVVERVHIRRSTTQHIQTIRETRMRERLEVDANELEDRVHIARQAVQADGVPASDAEHVES